MRASNSLVRKIKCKNLLLYDFYIIAELFDIEDIFAPFETNVLLGAKYPTNLLMSLFD